MGLYFDDVKVAGDGQRDNMEEENDTEWKRISLKVIRKSSSPSILRAILKELFFHSSNDSSQTLILSNSEQSSPRLGAILSDSEQSS